MALSREPSLPLGKFSSYLPVVQGNLLSLSLGSYCQMVVCQGRIAAPESVQKHVATTAFGVLLLHGQDNWERLIMKITSVHRDLFVVIVLTIIAVILAFIVPSGWVPVRILTLPLVLVLPGYALTTAIFPKRELGGPEHFIFSLGLSIVIVILSGLILNFIPFGLHVSSWAITLSAITLAACAVALVRRRRQNISTSGWVGVGGIGFTFRQTLLLGLAALRAAEQ